VTPKHTGWMVFLAMLGMMAGLVAVDVRDLEAWGQAMTPAFIGNALGHFAIVIGAFVGGKLIPTT
jgi:hypothetical protein